MNDLAERVATRLISYTGQFSPHVVERVAEVTAQTQHMKFEELMAYAGMPEVTVREYPGYAPIWLLDIPATTPTDEYSVTNVHMNMAGRHNRATMVRLARLHLMLPNERIIAVANPDGSETSSGNLTAAQCIDVAAGQLFHTLAPLYSYLEQNKIRRVNNVGTSYGAGKAAASTNLGIEHGAHDVDRVVAIEPACVVRQHLARLALLFLAEHPGMEAHIDTMEEPEYAALLREEPGLLAYIRTLFYPPNVAIGMSIARGGFAADMHSALAKQPGLSTLIAWGKKSKLATHAVMEELSHSFQATYGLHRVTQIALEGLCHALCLDPVVANALIVEGLQGERITTA